MSPSRIGVVGCGSWGRHVVRDLLTLEIQVAVVARSETSRGRARELGVEEIVPSVDELPDIDGAVVVTPTPTHHQVIRQLLDRDVPVFTEKPLTSDRSAAEELVRLAPERVFVMDKWRYHPGVEHLRELVRSGDIGELLAIRTERIGWGNPHDVDAAWILLPHDLSIFLEITGRVPGVKAAAGVAEGGDVDDAEVVVEGGSSWISALSPIRRRRVTVVGSQEIAVLAGGWESEILRYPHPAGSEVPEPRRDPVSDELPLLRELRAFIDHVRGGPPPRSSVSEGAAIVVEVDRARRMILEA